ncbi:MAG: penicillin acylase family protein, partial [Gemmatimonadota bacterium]
MSGRLGGRLAVALAVLLFLVGSAITVAYFQLRRSVQSTSGTVELEGLGEPAVVMFDSFSIPAIFASSEEDLFRVQGFVHAGERLWQMEMFRRIAQG